MEPRAFAMPEQAAKKARQAARHLAAGLLCVLCLCVTACGSKNVPRKSASAEVPPPEYGAYALEGPDLAVIGDLAGVSLRGSMQRKGMIGMGKLKLYAENNAFICESVIKSPPTAKGRIRGILDCSDGTVVLFTLRNLGPDQGLGIGTSHRENKDLTIFYHPSEDEAARRFPEILNDFTKLRQTKRQ